MQVSSAFPKAFKLVFGFQILTRQPWGQMLKKTSKPYFGLKLCKSKADCKKAAKNGPKWERLEVSVPLETQLYNEASSSVRLSPVWFRV